MSGQQNTQQPVAWVWQFPDGEFYETPHHTKEECERDCCGYDGMAVPLHTATPVPRDVLMEFGAAVRDACSFAVSGDIGVRSADKAMAGVDITALADSYANQAQPEPVNQQNTQPPMAWAVMRNGEVWRVTRFEPTEMGEVGGAVLVPLVPRTAIAATQPEPVNQQTLAALKAVLQWIDDWCETGPNMDFERVEAEADAAIAAAEAAQPVGDGAEIAAMLLGAADTICAQTGVDLREWAEWVANGGMLEMVMAHTEKMLAKQPASAQPVAVAALQRIASHRMAMYGYDDFFFMKKIAQDALDVIASAQPDAERERVAKKLRYYGEVTPSCQDNPTRKLMREAADMLTSAQPVARDVLNEDLPDAVIEATAEAIGDAYDCVRVWEAWGVGTMGPDDFRQVADDGDRVAEIARAAIIAWRASTAQPVAVPDALTPEARQYLQDRLHSPLCKADAVYQTLRAMLSAAQKPEGGE